MNSQKTIFNYKAMAAVLIYVLFAAGTVLQVNAAGEASSVAKLSKAESVAIASRELSKKLRSDLVLKNVTIKFSKTESYSVSDTQIGIKGAATTRLDNEANELPISFDVKIDVSRRSASDVKYVFLNMEGATAGAASALTAEDAVTEQLLQQIKRELKTDNIVVAIDFLNDQPLPNGEKGLTGGGEIQVNGMGWRKISFDVKAEQNEKMKFKLVKYQIK